MQDIVMQEKQNPHTNNNKTKTRNKNAQTGIYISMCTIWKKSNTTKSQKFESSEHFFLNIIRALGYTWFATQSEEDILNKQNLDVIACSFFEQNQE